MISTDGGTKYLRNGRKDLIADLGDQSEDFMAMIHTAIPDGKMWSLPKAKQSVDDGWAKLNKEKAFGMRNVMGRKEAKDMYAALNEPVHFGSVRQLCHEKHSELPPAQRVYKARVVFRSDTVKDADGYLAVFSEQVTSASDMTATTILDAIACMPYCDGEDSDAVGAYTQVELGKFQHLMGKVTSSSTRG